MDNLSADNLYLILFIGVATLATFATRAIPFLFLNGHHQHPLLSHIGRYLPPAVMALLVIIFLGRAGDWRAPVFGLDALFPCAIVIALHLWQRNTLLSIVAGTIAYMVLQQTGH